MKSAALLFLLFVAGCSGSRIRPAANADIVPGACPSELSDAAPTQIPHTGPDFNGVTEFNPVRGYQAVALWEPHFTVGGLSAPDEVDIPQTINPIRVGQRFEVWRSVDCIGMAIVENVTEKRVRARFDRPEKGQSLRVGDRLISRLWRADRPLHVAAHGSYEPPSEEYSKEEVLELLESAGCEVHEGVEPGVDLVILGSNLLSDEWYRQARSEVRFDTLREDDLRAYFLPPQD